MSAPMIVENIPVEQLIPYAKNARTHDDAQVAQIAASIREFGWTNPILIDGDKGVIAGHGRLMAARKLGMDTVPCIELSGTTLIAAEKNGRFARLMELDPKYVDVIVKRWQEFTGKQATHAATGATFNDIAADSALAIEKAA